MAEVYQACSDCVRVCVADMILVLSVSRFLFDNQGPAHVYYRWKLFSILQVCVCVWECVCVCVCVQVFVCVGGCVCVYRCTCVWEGVCVCVYRCTCVWEGVCVYVGVWVFTC